MKRRINRSLCYKPIKLTDREKIPPLPQLVISSLETLTSISDCSKQEFENIEYQEEYRFSYEKEEEKNRKFVVYNN